MTDFQPSPVVQKKARVLCSRRSSSKIISKTRSHRSPLFPKEANPRLTTGGTAKQLPNERWFSRGTTRWTSKLRIMGHNRGYRLENRHVCLTFGARGRFPLLPWGILFRVHRPLQKRRRDRIFVAVAEDRSRDRRDPMGPNPSWTRPCKIP